MRQMNCRAIVAKNRNPGRSAGALVRRAAEFLFAPLRLGVSPVSAVNPRPQIMRWGGSLTAAPSPRRGLTLLEVLVSMGVLSLGLLGVAALIPIGKMAMTETNKADRTGMCGRAALRDIKVRRMLDQNLWAATPTRTVFVIDPLGCTSALSSTTVGGTASDGTTISPVDRLNVLASPGGTALNATQAENIFRWQDDLNFVAARDSTNPTNGERPMPGGGGYIGDFSWFLTVTASPSEAAWPWPQKRQFNVSVVVCWKRVFTNYSTDAASPGETIVPNVTCDSADGYGGIGISYQNSTVMPKEKEWVLLYAIDPATSAIKQATWYRVVSAGSDGAATPATRVSLVGPDWHGGQGGTGSPVSPDNSVKLIVIKGVTGVYTRTVQLDTDTVWSR
jgi:prepilin-type N-terminal cleavage/methylation domain-containing protein